MYSRSQRPRYDRARTGDSEYPYKRHPAPESLPPNYGGSVFGEPHDEPDDQRDSASAYADPPRVCDECDIRPPRPAFGRLQDDDILLIGLIILLITSGADDDVIIMLAFLLVCTMRQ